MLNALDSLIAVIPVDVSNLKNVVNEYEQKNGNVRNIFVSKNSTAEEFANDVVCFLTTCDLYMDLEYSHIHQLWVERISDLIANPEIKELYKYLLNDAKTLAVSEHYVDRVEALINEL